MIERSGERGSGISMLAARHDDDVDDKRHHVSKHEGSARSQSVVRPTSDVTPTARDL